MATILGLAGLSASDYQLVRSVDAQVLYEATNQYLQMTNETRARTASLFVAGQTSKYTQRYQAPMGGMMAERTDLTKADALRRQGSWDVAFPLRDYGDTIATTRIDFAYMTPDEFQAHIDGVVNRANNRYRHEVLRRIFKNTTDTFTDKRWGSLTIQPLANNDSVLYPPIEGTDSEATANHYLCTSYATTQISDTYNPVKTATDLLGNRFGRRTGGIPVVSFIHPDQRAKIEGLTNFTRYVPSAITPGANTDVVQNLANVPGEIIGYTDSSWVSVWGWIPSAYMVSIHMEETAPLLERIDPPETQLGSGLQLINQSPMGGTNNPSSPFYFNEWSLRFGIGAANRLNGVVTFIDAGGTYTIPSAYQ